MILIESVNLVQSIQFMRTTATSIQCAQLCRNLSASMCEWFFVYFFVPFKSSAILWNINVLSELFIFSFSTKHTEHVQSFETDDATELKSKSNSNSDSFICTSSILIHFTRPSVWTFMHHIHIVLSISILNWNQYHRTTKENHVSRIMISNVFYAQSHTALCTLQQMGYSDSVWKII